MLGARFIININILYYMVDLALIILNVLQHTVGIYQRKVAIK